MRVDVDTCGEEFVNTFGGAFTDDCGTVDDYGLQIGDTNISGIKEKEFTALAVSIVNHLFCSGRDFEFFYDETSGQKFIREKVVKS